jgi:hypothetical protein
MSESWTMRPNNETMLSSGDFPAPTVAVMSSTMLTKRRAVDHCRVRSALCRMS